MLVFIDANIFVSLLSRPDLLNSLLDAVIEKIKQDKIRNLLPLTTQSEIIRNITEASNRKLKSLEFKPLSFNREESELKSKISKVNQEIEDHLNIKRKELNATKKRILDKIVKKIAPLSISPKETISLMNLAYCRKGKNFPPGKPGDKIGDQLAWEIILQDFQKEDTIIISQDPDWHNYNSTEKRPKLKYLLEEEWRQKSKRKIKIYYSISSFLDKEFGKLVKPKLKEPEVTKGDKSSLSDILDIALNSIPGSFSVAKSPSKSSSEDMGSGISWAIPIENIPSSGFLSGASIGSIGSIGGLNCNYCGNWVSSSDNFCSKCGRSLR